MNNLINNLKGLYLGAGIISLILGFAIFADARSAIHEIESFLLFIIAAILISAFGIISQLQKSTEELISKKK